MDVEDILEVSAPKFNLVAASLGAGITRLSLPRAQPTFPTEFNGSSGVIFGIKLNYERDPYVDF